MPTSITRDNLICLETATEAAFSKGTMFVMVKDDVVEIPIPESIKKKGIIPKGYALDHACDPSTVISALAESNKATIEQLPDGVFTKIKEILNGPDNVNIAPIDIVEEKRKVTENALKEIAQERDEESKQQLLKSIVLP